MQNHVLATSLSRKRSIVVTQPIASIPTVGVPFQEDPKVRRASLEILINLFMWVASCILRHHTTAPNDRAGLTMPVYIQRLNFGGGPNSLPTICLCQNKSQIAFVVFSFRLAIQLSLWSRMTPRYLTWGCHSKGVWLSRRGFSSHFCLCVNAIATDLPALK